MAWWKYHRQHGKEGSNEDFDPWQGRLQSQQQYHRQHGKEGSNEDFDPWQRRQQSQQQPNEGVLAAKELIDSIVRAGASRQVVAASSAALWKLVVRESKEGVEASSCGSRDQRRCRKQRQ